MQDLTFFQSKFRAAGCILACACASAGYAQSSSGGPVRLVRFSVVSGNVEWRPDTSTSWANASVNLPVRQGAQIWTPAGTRAELQFDDGTVVRLAPSSTLVLQGLYSDKDGEFTDLKLSVGHAYLRAPHAYSIYQFDTPDASVKVDGPARFRVDSGPNVRLAMYSGQAAVENDGGTTTVGAHQCGVVDSPSATVALQSIPDPDSWDQWNSSRDAVCFRTDPYVPRNVGLVSGELDSYGKWAPDPTYGHVWVPTETAGWQPYYHGRWAFVAPYGWTWVGAEPWGWAPYHYGSWIHRGYGWAWYPGPAMQYWSPAVVNFSYSGGSVCWAPLCPTEVQYPAAFSIGFGSGNWSLFFSIGGACVYDPGPGGICVGYPWVNAYVNGPGRWGVLPAYYQPYGYSASHFVPYNARFGGGVRASLAGFRGGAGFHALGSAGAGAFRNGRALSFGRGQAPMSGPAGAAPDPRSFSPNHSFASHSPSAAVMNRSVVSATASSFAGARRYTASRAPAGANRGSFARPGATAATRPGGSFARPGATGAARPGATGAAASRWNPNARANPAAAAAAARHSLNYSSRTGTAHVASHGATSARAQSFTRGATGAANVRAGANPRGTSGFTRAPANRAPANRAVTRRAATPNRSAQRPAATRNTNARPANHTNSAPRRTVNRTAPQRRSTPSRPAPQRRSAPSRPAPNRGGGGAPRNMGGQPRGGGGAPKGGDPRHGGH